MKQYHSGNILQSMDEELMEYIIKGNSLDVLQYFMNQQPELLKFKVNKYDLLYYAAKYNSYQIFKYLESFLINNDSKSYKKRKTSKSTSSLTKTINVKWDYYSAISVVPISGNIEMFLYLFDKVDIRSTLLNKKKQKKEYFNIIEAIVSSAKNDRSEMLEHIFGLFKSDRHLLEDILLEHIHRIVEGIIKNGHIHIIKQYFNNNAIHSRLKDKNLFLVCAQYDQFEMMKYLYDIKLGSGSFCSTTINFTCYHGNLEMIKWIHNHMNAFFTAQAMSSTIHLGKLEMIKWLHFNRTEGSTTETMNFAAEKGDLEIVKFLHFNRTEGCTTNAMDYAAENGHLEIVKFLHFNRTEGCTTDAMDYAAENGHLEIVKFLHENRAEGCTTNAMDNAAEYGNFEILTFLHENRTEGCSTKAKDMAEIKGHSDIVKWLNHNRTEGYTAKSIVWETYTSN